MALMVAISTHCGVADEGEVGFGKEVEGKAEAEHEI